MKTLGKFLISVLVFLLFAGSYYLGMRSVSTAESIRVDTVMIRDTIRDTLRIPVDRYITRVEKVYLTVPGDTVLVEVEVPFERKTYHTEDYRAVIEGFRPELVDMEIYRLTQFITKTETIKVPERRRWGVGIHAGYGATIQGGRAAAVPYVGVGVSYNIWSW